MTETALGSPALTFLTAFHADPLLALIAAVLIARFIFTLSDGASTLMVF